MSSHIRVGVCGFCRPQAELFSRFQLLEVQQTFYWPPQLKTVERWRQAAPENFEFTLKAFQAITHPSSSPTYRRAKFSAQQLAECGHFGDTPTVREAWETTRQLALGLGATTIVFQCPPRFGATSENVGRLRSFFHWIDRTSMRLAWAPRHASWSVDLIEELCRELDLIHAVDPLERASVHGEPAYFRLHGLALGSYRYKYNHPYSDEQLLEIRRRCLPGPTLCLFNNMQMAADAERLENLLRAATK
jgi:uncharacterized protein YecE (DUF72 family)